MSWRKRVLHFLLPGFMATVVCLAAGLHGWANAVVAVLVGITYSLGYHMHTEPAE